MPGTADAEPLSHARRVHQGQAVVENAAVVPQPGMKPALIDADTGPSNSVAHRMYKDGHEPHVHVDAPDAADADADAATS